MTSTDILVNRLEWGFSPITNGSPQISDILSKQTSARIGVVPTQLLSFLTK